MKLNEERIDGKTVYDGKLIKVEQDTVRLPNGKETQREVVRHQGGACVCVIDHEYNVHFVRQYRYAYGKEILELPAGKIENGEDPAETAKRELREEAGIIACDLAFLGEMYPSVGYTDEVIFMYLAVNVQEGEQQPDEDEFLKVEKIPFDMALNMAITGEIKDAKTQICLLKAYVLLESFNAEVSGAAPPDTIPQ